MKKILDLIFEFGQLKRVKRSGWWSSGVKDPESVADHTARVCFIGYLISKMEDANSEKVTLMILSHDMPECRIDDQNKVGARYINIKNAEKNALKDQVENLPPKIKKELLALHHEFKNGKTKEAIIAKDADYLECAIQAKEYLDIGYKKAENWINNVGKVLKTNSAKKIHSLIINSDSLGWWKDLKKLPKR